MLDPEPVVGAADRAHLGVGYDPNAEPTSLALHRTSNAVRIEHAVARVERTGLQPVGTEERRPLEDLLGREPFGRHAERALELAPGAQLSLSSGVP